MEALRSLVAGGAVMVLSGAGCSTASGIPDYRGQGRVEPVRMPIQWAAFRDDAAVRRRYWARASSGWPAIRDACPNAAHRALAELEAVGLVHGLVTQNVDGLHRRAGSQHDIELHGALREVVCLACSGRFARDIVQNWLVSENPHRSMRTVALAPDGDADVDEDRFIVPRCPACGGVLKPDVVFFGENVPRERVEASYGVLGQARALLVVGSSLTVFSGYRFVKRAHERGLPIAIVNQGPTRGDSLATVRIEGALGEVLPQLL